MVQDSALADIARRTGAFVVHNLFNLERFHAVGTRGCWRRGGGRPEFDQLASETASVVELCRTGAIMTADPVLSSYAHQAMAWFEGRNVHGIRLIDPSTGGCCRALRAQGVDRNQERAGDAGVPAGQCSACGDVAR